VYVRPESAGYKVLVEDCKVRGVRTGTRARRDGEELSTRAGLRVIARPPCWRGSLGPTHGAALRYLDPLAQGSAAVGAGREGGLGGRKPLAKVVHTMGWPRAEAK